MKKVIIVLVILLVYASNITAQKKNLEISWKVVMMDSLFDKSNMDTLLTTAIIAKYKPSVDSLLVPLIYTPKDLRSFRPESPLSNLTGDIIKWGINNLTTNKVDLAFTDFAQIRADLPQGNISRYSIMSAYPFVNKLVVVSLKGEILLRVAQQFAKENKAIIYSGVRLKITHNKIKYFKINGKSLKQNKSYKVGILNFMLMSLAPKYGLDKAENVEIQDITFQDALYAYFDYLNTNHKKLNPVIDNRVVIK